MKGVGERGPDRGSTNQLLSIDVADTTVNTLTRCLNFSNKVEVYMRLKRAKLWGIYGEGQGPSWNNICPMRGDSEASGTVNDGDST